MHQTEKFVSPPTPEALAHSDRLLAELRRTIDRRGGWLGFEDYMAQALYAPGLGYYSAGAQKLGAAGDFVTAPELSPLFGRCLARQCAEILQPGDDGILELGAGSGALAGTLLAALDELNGLPQRYAILEPAADLRQRQQAYMTARHPALADRVQWLDTLPAAWRGVILGNEVVDALPVQRFRVTEAGPLPLGVIWDNGLSWRQGPVDERLTVWLEALQTRLGYRLPLGYESERNPQLDGWMAALADTLVSGVILLIDYGHPRAEYYHPDRIEGTLRCYYRHQVHGDPLRWPGLQDITASVDFTALADAGLAAGLELAGYTNQTWFLLGCGLTELLNEVDPTDTRRYLALAQQAKVLTLPGEMGERCKAMALQRERALPLRGFALCEQRDRICRDGNGSAV